jgi:hypothetical protein
MDAARHHLREPSKTSPRKSRRQTPPASRQSREGPGRDRSQKSVTFPHQGRVAGNVYRPSQSEENPASDFSGRESAAWMKGASRHIVPDMLTPFILVCHSTDPRNDVKNQIQNSASLSEQCPVCSLTHTRSAFVATHRNGDSESSDQALVFVVFSLKAISVRSSPPSLFSHHRMMIVCKRCDTATAEQRNRAPPATLSIQGAGF